MSPAEDRASLFQSAIVVAHPDDELLWFGSIVDKVGQIFICFSGHPGNLDLSYRRRLVEKKYPLKNVSFLRVEESAALDQVDWPATSASPFGLTLTPNAKNLDFYKKNKERLCGILRRELAGFRNVFTHNPWGEYGHPDHVQVYRVVTELQKELGYSVWATDYFSRRTAVLSLRSSCRFADPVLRHSPDEGLLRSIRALYDQYGCWTWFENDEALGREAIRRLIPEGTPARGALVPGTFIRMLDDIGADGQRKASDLILWRSARAVKRRVRTLLSTGRRLVKFKIPSLIAKPSSARVCIVSLWFGPLPKWFFYYLETCRQNAGVDWLFVTDQSFEAPPNFKILQMTLAETSAYFADRLGVSLKIEQPYKICDFKPTFGEVFKDHLIGYAYWGHSDIDLFWGNLSEFLAPLLGRYDIISTAENELTGVLTLFRNDPSVNRLYLKHPRYREILTDPDYCSFDEIEMTFFIKSSGLKVFWEDLHGSFSRFEWRQGCLVNKTRKVAYFHFGGMGRKKIDKVPLVRGTIKSFAGDEYAIDSVVEEESLAYGRIEQN